MVLLVWCPTNKPNTNKGSGRAPPGESCSLREADSLPPRRRTPTRRAASSALRRLVPAGRSSRRGRWHGQRHRSWVHCVEVQVGDPADGVLGPVVFAQLRVVGLSERLEDAAQPSHDGGPHVSVGLLVGDQVNQGFASRVPQHSVPGGSRQRDVVDGSSPDCARKESR